jgi:paspaline synthase
LAVFLLTDASYGVCYWYVRQYEKSLEGKNKQI